MLQRTSIEANLAHFQAENCQLKMSQEYIVGKKFRSQWFRPCLGVSKGVQPYPADKSLPSGSPVNCFVNNYPLDNV